MAQRIKPKFQIGSESEVIPHIHRFYILNFSYFGNKI